LQEGLDATGGIGHVEQRPAHCVGRHAGHDRPRRGGQAEDGTGSAQRGRVVGVEQQPAAAGDDQTAPSGQLLGHGRLHLAEARFALVVEDGGDWLAGATDDDFICIDEGAPQPRRQ